MYKRQGEDIAAELRVSAAGERRKRSARLELRSGSAVVAWPLRRLVDAQFLRGGYNAQADCMAMLALRLLLLVCGATLAVGQQPAPAGTTAASPRAAEEEQVQPAVAAEVVAAVQPEEGHEQRRELLTRAEAKRRKRCRKLVRVQNKLVKAAGNEKKERKLQRKLDKLTEKGYSTMMRNPSFPVSETSR